MEIPKIEISAEKIADKVLDEIEFKGKNIREWAEYLIRNADDLISRQAMLLSLEKLKIYAPIDMYDECVYLEDVKDLISSAFSVQPEQKTGRWFDVGVSCRCSECGCKNNRESRYCPNCGAKMESEEG